MNDHAMKFRLGVFVLGAAILLAVLVILFGQMPLLVSRPYEYVVRFPEAPGIEAGGAVRKSGVRIGEVQSVDLDPNSGAVSVRIAIDKKFQLRKGDKATIGRSLILGDATINFLSEDRTDREPAPSEFVFQGDLPADLRQYLKDATSLVPTTQQTLEEFRETAKGVREALPALRQTNMEIQLAASNVAKLTETADNFVRGNQDRLVKAVDNFVVAAGNAAEALNEENRKNLTGALRNVNNATTRLEGLVRETETFVAETRGTVKKVGDRIESVGQNADGFITETRATVKSLGTNLETLTKDTDLLVVDARTTVKAVGKQVEAVGNDAQLLIADSRKTVKTAGDRIDAVGKQAEDFMKEGRLVVQRAGDVLTDVQNATRPIGEKAPLIMRNLEESTTRINQVTYNVAEFTKSLNNPDGSLRKLLTEPNLYANVNDAANNLNKSMARFDRILQDFNVFSDKVARHPELLGVSGAVSPSSGSKR